MPNIPSGEIILIYAVPWRRAEIGVALRSVSPGWIANPYIPPEGEGVKEARSKKELRVRIIIGERKMRRPGNPRWQPSVVLADPENKDSSRSSAASNVATPHRRTHPFLPPLPGRPASPLMDCVRALT